MITLYRKHANGSVGFWRARVQLPHLIYEYAVGMAGAVTSNSEIVSENNSGRSLADQAVLMLKARAKRKAQRGYKATFEEALNSKHQTFDDGILAPMLAQRVEKSRHKNGVPHSVAMFEQPKLDGHRCQIVKTIDGEMRATSRLGTRITTIDHLLEKLKPSMPDDLPIDGELYVHGWKVQHVASAVKRLQEDTQKVTFQAYDVYDMDQGFGLRFDTLMGIMRPAHAKDHRLNVVYTGRVYDVEQAWDRFGAYRAAKYEGAMLRIDGAGYEPGIRSSNLLKLKAQEDGEFRIKNIELSKRDVPVMTLVTGNGKLFQCTAPGSYGEKMEIYNNRHVHIDKMVTCEWASLTDEGVPFHCVALRIREDI